MVSVWSEKNRIKIFKEVSNLALHRIKLREEFCDDVICERKTFEVRLNDRNYQIGDRVSFTAVTADGKHIYHKINNATYLITYVLSGYGINKNYVAFAIKRVK